jgi:SAM-dependent methyltransferase
MLDPETYRSSERLAKSLIPSWRISQIHNLDLFERVGFPVRIQSVRELSQIIDTMQENRFDRYMAELDGLSESEFAMFVDACADVILFQAAFLPHKRPILPISTMISALAIYLKLQGAKANFKSVLELGPGCGYVSFFLKRHAALTNYSQVEACESFYILQNLVNLDCFGARQDERAHLHEDIGALDYFTNINVNFERSPSVAMTDGRHTCTHYPWWRIGEIVSKNIAFDLVTSNANLLEFSSDALGDYLALMHRALKPDGAFLVQCTGFEANGTVKSLLERIEGTGFAPLMFVRERVPVTVNAQAGELTTKGLLIDGARGPVTFTTNNALFVKAGHPLFEKYYNGRNFHDHFIADEPLVASTFFSRPVGRRRYAIGEIVEATEKLLRTRGL